MARRGGLGKGLGALIPPGSGDEGDDSLFREVPVTSVAANRRQPRTHFDEEALAALTSSVRELGVLQPILVRATGPASYELIAGERRLRAARRAGMTMIPAIVRTADDTTSLEHALVENIQREDLNPMDEAAAYQQLIEDFHLTHDDLAVRVGRSRAAITNTLRLFQLPPSVQRLVADGKLTAGHARALLATPDRSYQETLAKRAVDEGLSVRAVEAEARRRNEHNRPSAQPDRSTVSPSSDSARANPGDAKPAALLELEELLANQLDTRVRIEVGAAKGRVVIDFADLEDLERIFRAMSAS